MDLVVGQLLAALSYGSTLFLVSAGLTLIFGVTRIINFAHGALYMIGAYLAYTLSAALGASTLGFFGGVLLAAAIVGLIGALLETTLMRRIYDAPEIFQLLATFGVALVAREATQWIWGSEELFAPRVPGLAGSFEVAGAFVPQYNVVLTLIGPLVFIAMLAMLGKTRWGMQIRAATQDREMASALGINERRLFTTVFALGAFLAALAGGLQIPRDTINLQMDLNILVEAFVVVVVGGLGSVKGAFWASMLIGIVHSFGIWLLPQSTLVLVFVVMAVVLIVRPYGLLGRPEATTRSVQGALSLPYRPATRGLKISVCIIAAIAVLLPFVVSDYWVVIATETAILALYAASLQLFMAHGGIVSFGHAATFGAGAYGAGVALKFLGAPFVLNLLIGPLAGFAAAALAGFFVLRAQGVYAAMLTLAFAQILWSLASQWVSVTGGDNGLLGVWPPTSSISAYYYISLALILLALIALHVIALSPFGFSLRAVRDATARAEAVGIDARRLRWIAFSLGGLFSGLAGALQAYQKGSVFPDSLSIPLSVDALVIVLLGGLQSLSGAWVGAIVYHGVSVELARATDHWRGLLGFAIVAMVLLFPNGIAGALRARFEQRSVP